MSAAETAEAQTEPVADAPPGEDPRQHAVRVEQLLADVRAMVSPVAWPRVEELVARLVALYGAALGRVLVLVGEERGLDERLRARLCEDELVSGLLALHGMHPTPVAVRVREAVARVVSHLAGAGAVDSELDERGVARLQLAGTWRCAVPRATVEEALRRAIEEAAPEVAEIQIDGVDWSAPGTPALVQLDLGRSRPGGVRKPAP